MLPLGVKSPARDTGKRSVVTIADSTHLLKVESRGVTGRSTRQRHLNASPPRAGQHDAPDAIDRNPIQSLLEGVEQFRDSQVVAAGGDGRGH